MRTILQGGQQEKIRKGFSRYRHVRDKSQRIRPKFAAVSTRLLQLYVLQVSSPREAQYGLWPDGELPDEIGSPLVRRPRSKGAPRTTGREHLSRHGIRYP